jgi:hypothetical protein
MDGGAGSDSLDYSQAGVAGVHVVLDFTAGTATKFQGAVLIGTDIFRNIEHVIGSS